MDASLSIGNIGARRIDGILKRSNECSSEIVRQLYPEIAAAIKKGIEARSIAEQESLEKKALKTEQAMREAIADVLARMAPAAASAAKATPSAVRGQVLRLILKRAQTQVASTEEQSVSHGVTTSANDLGSARGIDGGQEKTLIRGVGQDLSGNRNWSAGSAGE